MVASQTQAGRTLSFTLDPARRLRTQTDSATGLTETNHYDGTSDSPSWIAKSDGTWQRFASAIGADMAAQIDSTGAVTLQLTNLHGDVVATCDTGTTGINAYHEQTEYGIPRDSAQVGTRYAWLGANQRSGDDLGGLILMGVRLYDPTAGRFLQPDPIPGGSANDYDYADQDPINNRDFDGRFDIAEMGRGEGGASIASWDYVAQERAAVSYRNSRARGGSRASTHGRGSGRVRASTGGGSKKPTFGGKRYKTEEEARAAAKGWLKNNVRCAFRGPCKKGDHVHIDIRNWEGRHVHTEHFHWPK
jgi:RHS repeat-associated protein